MVLGVVNPVVAPSRPYSTLDPVESLIPPNHLRWEFAAVFSNKNYQSTVTPKEIRQGDPVPPLLTVRLQQGRQQRLTVDFHCSQGRILNLALYEHVQ